MKKRKIHIPQFETAGHSYTTVNGELLPSVTTVIKDELNLFQCGNQIAAKRGEYIHLACQYHDEGILKLDSVDDIIMPFYQQYCKFLAEHPEVKILENEIMRYHPKYMFAGRIDKIANIKGNPAIIDVKTSNTLQEQVWHRWQIAAYAKLLEAEKGQCRRFILYLTPTNYLFQEHTSNKDFLEFMTLLSAYNLKHNYGYYKKQEER